MYRALLLAVTSLLATAPWLASTSIAAPAMSSPTYVPFKAPKSASFGELNQATGSQSTAVLTFDTAGRAQVIARELPRFWSGSYQGFASGAAVPVQLKLSGAKAIGQVVELRVINDLDSDEVCRTLAISEQNLFVRLHRARRALAG